VPAVRGPPLSLLGFLVYISAHRRHLRSSWHFQIFMSSKLLSVPICNMGSYPRRRGKLIYRTESNLLFRMRHSTRSCTCQRASDAHSAFVLRRRNTSLRLVLVGGEDLLILSLAYAVEKSAQTVQLVPVMRSATTTSELGHTVDERLLDNA
jgi:hypothetical protein